MNDTGLRDVAVRSWPFWAPSRREAVDEALDLAGVGAGTRILDLGCGDGQVLLAAAERGAIVSGIESDAALADEARDHLRHAGVSAEIWCADLLDPAVVLEADVYFTYLAPATLQRLLPRLRADAAGRRLVTVDFDVPGIVPTRRGQAARLYRLPGRTRKIPAPGWSVDGTLVAAAPHCQSLTCIELVHPRGTTAVDLSPDLHPFGTALSGADSLDHAAHLAVDIRWNEHEAGTTGFGAVRCAELPDHPIVVVFTEEDDGTWELSGEAVANLRDAFRGPRPPSDLAGILEVCGA